MALGIPVPLALGRFKQLPQRALEVWQGAFVRLPMWVDHPTDPDGDPYRPIAALWVSARTGLIHMDLPPDGASTSADFALAALVEFGLKWAKRLEGRPRRVEVRDPALRDALAEGLTGLSTSVVVVDDLPLLREALANLEAETGGGRVPGLLDSPGVTPDRIRAFADAAVGFYTARPWDSLANEDLIVVDSERMPRGMRHISVLGQGGHQFGLSFFESRDEFDRVLRLAEAGRHANRAHGVTFGALHELPFGDVDAWLDHALPVAGRRAYPLVADLGSDGTVRRPSARELTSVEALLRAMAATTEDEMDTGQWSKEVQTFDGPVSLRISLPLLLETEAHGGRAVRVAALSRSAERAGVRIARLLESQSFDSIEDVNAKLERARQAGLLDAEAVPGRDLTPLERAQELAYDALEAEGRLRIKRAREALAISADCADAWTLLAESGSTPETARGRYELAVAAGARAIGTDRFDSLVGEFWSHFDTRPYMRARLGLARTLEDLGHDDDAIAHYRELLRLNPNDNQGVRYLLVVALLRQGRDEAAGVLLDEHRDDIQALWPYARVLWSFRTSGDSPGTRAWLEHAVGTNRHVLQFLADDDGLAIASSASFALGSKEEAANVVDELGDLYEATPGLMEWLRAQPPPRPSRPPRRPRQHRARHQ